MDFPRVAIIVLNWNNYADTRECLVSLEKITYPNSEIIVVDNGSTDGSGERLKVEFPYHIFIRNEINLGFAGGNNVGIRYALEKMFDFILFLNNDTVVDKGFLEPAIRLAAKDDSIGIVGAKIYYYSDPKKIWAAGGGSLRILWISGPVFRLYGYNQADKGQFDAVREIDWCVGAFMLIKREVFEKIGLLPECYFLCMEEGEFAVKARKAGFKIFYTPESVIWHKIGVSSNTDIKHIYNGFRNRLLFTERTYPSFVWRAWFLLFRFCINFLAPFRWKMTKRDKKVSIEVLQKVAKLACNDHTKSKKVTEKDLIKVEQILFHRNYPSQSIEFRMELVITSCDLCTNNNDTLLFRARDYRFGREEEYSVVKCNNCGLIYINPRPTAEFILKLYEADYTPKEIIGTSLITKTANWKINVKGMLYELYGYIGNLPRKGKILELGCGEGAILEILSKRGCEVWGVEPNPKAAGICKSKGLNVLCGTLEKANFRDGFFDAVVMSHVLEHLPSPKRALKEVKRVTKPKGRVYIYCPNVESYLSKLFGRYWHGWHIPFHFYGFTKKTILELANDAGFKVTKIDTITPPHFFTTSLKSFLFGDSDNILPPIKRGKALDNPLVKVLFIPPLRILDFILKGKGDCLRIEFVK